MTVVSLRRDPTTVVARANARISLGPLVKLMLNVRATTLLLVVVTTAHVMVWWELAVVLGLMASTSVLPVLVWSRVGGWLLRHPLGTTVDLALTVLLLLVVDVAGPLPLYAVTTAVLMGVLYGRSGGLLLAAPLVLAHLAGRFAVETSLDFASVALVPVLVVAGAVLGAELRRLLLERDAALAQLRDSLVLAATAEERARLSRELHDSVAKTLQGIALLAAGLPRLAESDPERARQELTHLREAADQASLEARRLLRGLRADDLTAGVDVSLRSAIETWSEDQGVAVTTDLAPVTGLDPDVRHELFQIVAEALRNVAAHAGANHVHVAMSTTGGGDVELTVTDDGAGFTLPDLDDLARAGHFGVVGLHERAVSVGGTTTVATAPGAGTSVRVTLPRTSAAAPVPLLLHPEVGT